MHFVIRDPGVPAYLDALEELRRLGARRVCFRGDAGLAATLAGVVRQRGLAPLLAGEPEAACDAVVLCPAAGEEPGAGNLPPAELTGHLVYPGRRPPFLGVVSIHKAGTNLLAALLRGLGYQVIGHGVAPPWPKPARGTRPREREWEYLAFPPADCAYVTHSLPVFTGDDVEPRPLLKLWCERHFPLLFHYRDPRAVLCSYVRYVMKAGRSGEFTVSPFTQVCSETLSAIADPAARLTLALEMLGEYMTWAFRDNAWLLHHPAVCRTRYELLAGPEGGGERALQILEVARLMVHLSAGGDPAALAERIYDRQTRTFAVGRIDSWRQDLGPENQRLFERLYGDILATFGYPSAA
jgi:hypothetical protein